LTIIDSSVAVKWFVSDAEPRRRQALAVLEEACAEPNRFAVPELFYNLKARE
jgi:predicted nucleic acid-binding protein